MHFWTSLPFRRNKPEILEISLVENRVVELNKFILIKCNHFNLKKVKFVSHWGLLRNGVNKIKWESPFKLDLESVVVSGYLQGSPGNSVYNYVILRVITTNQVSWCSWLSRQSNTLKVSGSSPGDAIFLFPSYNP